MDYFKKIYDGLSTTGVGMKITLEHLFGKKVTNQYPEIYHPITSGDMPLNSRNRLFVDMAGCDGCDSCAKACPINCIEVETVRVTPDEENVPDMNNGKKRKMWVTKHEIDFAKCCFCSLCTLVCPTEAIYMTQEFEYSEFDRENLKYNFSDLTPEQVVEKKASFEQYQIKKKEEQEAKKKADAEAKKAAEEALANLAKEEESTCGSEEAEDVTIKEEPKKVEPPKVEDAPTELSEEDLEKQKARDERRRENERKRAERMAAKAKEGGE
ncbi:MAG: 4Fe-4S binding protein [Candidatus Kapabacteria bacterium]|nr:4Fe-4S binding protein [Ignavibacteriota bacterium]MCW5885593.1 4Fe-4S binding protein [Candidatus Kapabacteria bacterium]